MIKIENVSVSGWEQAIRGCRNPYNSWHKSDSIKAPCNGNCDTCYREIPECDDDRVDYLIGPNDHDLVLRLAKAGPEHSKYRRMIVVYADITAPLYWWKETDTYKVGTVANSCSTMHTIHKKEFTLDDFSHEHLSGRSMRKLFGTIDELNYWRDIYVNGGNIYDEDGVFTKHPPKNKEAWYQMIQLLPTSYNQRRTVMLNYEVLSSMYRQRKRHKLDEWNQLCDWIETLPYSELITLKEPDTTA